MGKELVPFKVSNLPVLADKQVAEIDEVSKGTEYLPRIQLISKGKYVDTGKIAPGRWGIPLPGGEDITDLGPSIDVIPFWARTKALDMNDKEAIISVFDPESAEYNRIKTAAGKKNSGCMYGPDYLVLERSTGKLYELFFGNKSGRNEAGKMKAFMANKDNPLPTPCTLNIRYIKKEFGWHVPVIIKCSEPFDQSKCVGDDVILAEIEKFSNPAAGEEKVDEADAPTDRVR